MGRITVPVDWDDNYIVTVEELGEVLGVPPEQLTTWRARGVGPRWRRFQGVGRLYVIAAEARRFLARGQVLPGGGPDAA